MTANVNSPMKMQEYINRLSKDQLIQGMQSDSFPGWAKYLAAGRLQEIAKMEQSASAPPRSTVRDDLISAASRASQPVGINALAQHEYMPEAEPQTMARGGIIKMSDGSQGAVSSPELPSGMPVDYGSKPFETFVGALEGVNINPFEFVAPPSSPGAKWNAAIEQIRIKERLPNTPEGNAIATRMAQALYTNRQTPTPTSSQQDIDAARSALTSSGISPEQQELIRKYPGTEVISESTIPSTPTQTTTQEPTTASVSEQVGGDYPQNSAVNAALQSSGVLPVGDYPPTSAPGTAPTAGTQPALPAPPIPPGVGIGSIGGGGAGAARGVGGMGGAAGGGGGLPSGAAGGLPSIAGGMAGSPTADIQARMAASEAAYDKIIEEMRENRPNLSKLKEDAKWRFLAEFGAGLASGKGNFAQSMGAALGPAMQSYGKEMQSIRQEIRDSYKGDLEAYKAKSEALYRSGKLSQDEFHVRMQVAGQLEAAKIHAGAATAAAAAHNAGKVPQTKLLEMLQSGDEQQVNAARSLLGHGIDRNTQAMQTAIQQVDSIIERERQHITTSMPDTTPDQKKRKQEAIDALEKRKIDMLGQRMSILMPPKISNSPTGNIAESYSWGNQ